MAVIGASDEESKLGFHVMKSLKTSSFQGRIYPINPSREKVHNIVAYPSLSKVKDEIDLAIVVVPANKVESVFKECVEKKVKGIVLITAGFKEIEDPAGWEAQENLRLLVQDPYIPVIGPNTFGMINYHHCLNASFTPEFSLASAGGSAIVSQSGGMSHYMGFMAMENNLGLSYIIGLGNRLNLDFYHVLPYLAGDTNTKVIGLYIEGLEAPRLLMEAISQVSERVPIVVMKAGRGDMADKASLSHTGSMAGDHKTFCAAMLQSGALVVEDTGTFMDILKAYEKGRPPKGPRAAILSGQAGPGIIAYDSCIQNDMEVVPFTGRTKLAIESMLPPMAIRTNPVDLGPLWYKAEVLAQVVDLVLDDPEIDIVFFLMMFASANVSSVPVLVRHLMDRRPTKPIFTCIKAPGGIWDRDIKLAEDSGILVNFQSPERMVRAAKLALQLERIRAKTRY